MKSRAAAVLADRIEAAAVAPPKQEPAGPGLALVRRILQARDPSALAELDAGLVEAAKGEPSLVAWLTRPIARPEITDPLQAALDGLATVNALVAKISPTDRRAATFLGALSNLSKTVENISKNRPSAPTVDEVTERIAKVRDEAVRKILEHTTEAREKLAKDRADLVAWAGANLGPMIAAELERRLGVMLGETPPA
jgi:phosphoribosyl-ATP pyrophosphohydrolase